MIDGEAGWREAPLRVLLVADDPEVVETVRALLADSAAVHSVEVETGYDAGLRALAPEEADLCLVHDPLGQRSGEDFIREAAVRAPDLPIVLLTAGGTDVARRGMEAGAVDHLPTTDLSADRLERAMRYAVERIRRRLAESRDRFQAELLSAVGQAVIATDLEGTILYWNTAAERLYGWTREEALGRPVVELTTPGATQEQAEEIMAAVRERRSWSGEWRSRRKDGSTFVALVTDSPFFDADGELQGIIGVSSDISELKETESALRERVKELRTLGDASRILNDATLPVEDRLQRLVEIVPEGWLDPERTEARLVLDGREFLSAGFRETPWMLTAPISYADAGWGRLDVALTERGPDREVGPFLAEEQALLDNLGLLIGDVLTREQLERRLRGTVAALDEAVLIVRGRAVIDANPAAERMFGYPRHELVGSTTEKLHVDRAAFERFGAVSVEALETKGIFRGSYPLRRSDGEVFRAEQTVSLLKPEEGAAGGAVSVIRDVSDRVRAETELRSSEERFRQIAESIDDVFWIRAPDDSRVEYVSPAFAQIWGRPVEAVAANPSLWLESVLPSDRKRLVESLTRQREDGYEIEYRIVRPDGEIRWIFERAFPVREDGEVARIVGVAEDITARKLAEERFSVLSQEVADGIHVIAPDGRILFATPAAEAALGYSPEELLGKNALDLAHPEDRGELRDLLWEVVQTPGQIARRQYRGITRDQEVRYLESVGRNRIDHPAIGGVVVTTRDVTARHRLEEQLRQSQKMEAIGRLAGGIAHDFNNLLTVIRSQTDLLLMDLEEQGSRTAEMLETELATIQSAADRAAALTSQLLAFSREQILQPRVIDLSAVVFDMARLLERIIGEDIALERQLEKDLPAARLDPGQLEQAIINLAVNARDAMPAGGTLTLRTRSETVSQERAASSPALAAGRYVVIEVSDTGTGMDSETRSHVFEPFFTTKEKGKGTGLGLAMVYGVVTQSGGTVSVRSEPGEGSTFTLRFPTVDEEPDRPQARRRTEAPRTLSRRLLVVEDDEAVRRVTTRILERSGIEVEAVGTAEAGLEALSGDHDFDLLLTDLVLPGMSGRDLVDRLQAADCTIPIIVMSGYAEDSPGERGDLPEDISFLQKPFTPKGLVQMVHEALLRP